MRHVALFFVTLGLITLAACSRMRELSSEPGAASKTVARPSGQGEQNALSKDSQARMQQISLKQADESQSAAEAMDRKIIRNADLTVEVDSPTEAQRKITSIAESHGGFVVTSEVKRRETNDPARSELDVTLIIRIPSGQFGSALDAIRALGSRIIQEKITGQDVTEEFIDLEARIKTQKALEAQFLEIMKQAKKVGDALEVQRQIADVRTEIEKLEGRKRFLENRASLSTVTVNLQPPTAIVSATGFGRNVKEAIRDSVDVASAIVLFLVRFVILMVPILFLIVIPAGLIFRYAMRRRKRLQLAREP